MSVASSLFSSISGYIPTAVKEAAGLSPQISEAVRHITWLSIERIFWPEETLPRQLVVIGYTDGFQVWDFSDPAASKELISKQDKAVLQARMLPCPLLPVDVAADVMGVACAPVMAYLHKSAPALVRLFSLKSHDDVHLLRLTEPAKSLQASRKFFAVGFAKSVELYDSLRFQVVFSVQCHGAMGPTYALGQRWLAYNIPPHEKSDGSWESQPRAGGGLSRQLKDGLQYLGQVGQRTLDQVLMPSPEASFVAPPSGVHGAVRSGSIAVRDVVNQNVISQFEEHSEAIEAMTWDPSGLQLVTCGALGHKILVHRAMLGTGDTLLDADQDGLQLGSLRFQHVFTLSRGVTPAVISGVAVSEDSQFVAVSSAKGTTHVFNLPAFHVRQQPGRLREPGARHVPGPGAYGDPGTGAVNLQVCTRVWLGSVLLQEGLLPQCAFISPSARPRASSGLSGPCMYVATRAGLLAVYSLTTAGAASTPEPSLGEDTWVATLQREVRICRQLRHFSERRLGTCSRDSPRSPRISEEGGQGNEPSKWLSYAETATHLPTDVPIWISPQLRFYAYPAGDAEQMNQQLRRGERPAGCRCIDITRPKQPGVDAVHHQAFASSELEAAAQQVSLLGGHTRRVQTLDDGQDEDWVIP